MLLSKDNSNVLKRALKKAKQDVDTRAFGDERFQELKSRMVQMQATAVDVNHKLSCWANIEGIKDIVQIREMEASALKSLDRLNKIKEFLARKQRLFAAPNEQVFPQIHNFGIEVGSSSNGHNFPMGQRDVGGSTNPIQPNVNVGSGMHFNFENPYQHHGPHFVGSGNSMAGPHRNPEAPIFCPAPHRELMYHIKNASRFVV